jgi:UDP-glucose 4-epimerase
MHFKPKKILVTGCAGFIGSNLVDRLLGMDLSVRGVDNLSTGNLIFLESAFKNEKFEFFESDLFTDTDNSMFENVDFVFHFSANADVRYGAENTRRDIEQNIIVTHNVLENMRLHGVSQIVFSSTGSVYGESLVIPTTEDAPFPIQTSLYGSSKVACEGLISSYCEAFEFQAWIFRFVSILGERYTHGHVFDFCKSLSSDPASLRVLGNGKQRKSYLYIQDCIDAILVGVTKSKSSYNVFNLGTDEFCEVNESVKLICNELNLSPTILHSGGDRGWVGDNPFIYLDTQKIRLLGWKPKLTIQEGILKTVKWLTENKWVFNDR